MPRHGLTREVETDLDDIWNYVARDSRREADRLIDSITERFAILATQPFMGRARPELGQNLRSFPVESYLIIYRPTDYGVEVVRVVHGRRNIEAMF
jgi:toxin ParE1/3/4